MNILFSKLHPKMEDKGFMKYNVTPTSVSVLGVW